MIIRQQWSINRAAFPAPTPPSAPPSAAAAGAAPTVDHRALLAAEESLYRRAIRDFAPEADPITGIVAPGKQEPSHQPFDIQAANSNVAVVQGAQGYRIAIQQLLIYNSGDQQTITLLDGGTGNTLMGPLVSLPATAGLSLPWQEVPYFTLTPGQAFVIQTDTVANCRLTGFLKYRLDERGVS